jgi:hypothetical protein
MLRGSFGQGGCVTRLKLCDRHQHVVHFALHEARCAFTAVTQQPYDFAHRLAGALIGDAVNHDDGDAIGVAHRQVRITRARSLK